MMAAVLEIEQRIVAHEATFLLAILGSVVVGAGYTALALFVWALLFYTRNSIDEKCFNVWKLSPGVNFVLAHCFGWISVLLYRANFELRSVQVAALLTVSFILFVGLTLRAISCTADTHHESLIYPHRRR